MRPVVSVSPVVCVARAVVSGLVLSLVILLVTACATTQSRYAALAGTYPPLPDGYDVAVFRQGYPAQSFVRIARLDVHIERTYFIGSGFEDALPELKRLAREAGAQAIVEIEERSSMVGETKIYHVTATGIRYLQP